MERYSPGCQCCQTGGWLCIYLTYLCNGGCRFCPAPLPHSDRVLSDFGADPHEILHWINKVSIRGISFSGGDCFLAFDRLRQWLPFFKHARPDIYYWAYTNGLEASEEKLAAIAEAGLDELRFNIAATGYTSLKILKRIRRSVRLFPSVAVEIPSIPEDYDKLATVLSELDNLGVRYLNLHEYLLQPNDPHSARAVAGVFLFNKIDKIRYEAYSMANTGRIMDFCLLHNLKIVVNNCSLRQKEHQLLQRRMMMGKLLQQSFERLTDEGLYETFLPIPDKVNWSRLRFRLAQPGGWLEFKKSFFNISKDMSEKPALAKIIWLPPLAVDDERRFVRAEKCTQSGGDLFFA